MKLPSAGAPHLTYCTNIHAGETWPEVQANLERYVVAVKERVARDPTAREVMRQPERNAGDRRGEHRRRTRKPERRAGQ